jgi:hypothetical protein
LTISILLPVFKTDVGVYTYDVCFVTHFQEKKGKDAGILADELLICSMSSIEKLPRHVRFT